MVRVFLIATACAVATVLGASSLEGKEFTELPDNIVSIVDGLEDGSIVVGDAEIDGEVHAYLWSRTDGFVDLGFADSVSHANAISADGTMVVGWYVNADGVTRAFYWTAETDMVDFGTAGGPTATAYDVSADGSAVVGVSANSEGNQEAFLWTEATGVVGLGTLGSIVEANSEALFVSADGTRVVGRSETELGAWNLFLWTAADGMVDLGSLGGEDLEVLDTSADATVIVGTATNLLGASLAYKWTDADGITVVSVLPDVEGSASLVSDDGSTIAGQAEFAADLQQAFLVEAEDLIELGGFVAGGASTVTSINVDGSTLGGQAINAQGNLEAFFRTETEGSLDNVGDLVDASFDDVSGYTFVDVPHVTSSELAFYAQATVGGQTQFVYIELPDSSNIFENRPWAEEIDSYVTLAYYYSYNAAIENPADSGAYYSFLYAYYAYLYQQVIADLTTTPSNEQAMIDYYIQLRYEATVMSYYGYAYQYYYLYLSSFGQATFTTEALESNYYAFYYQLYDFEDLLDD